MGRDCVQTVGLVELADDREKTAFYLYNNTGSQQFIAGSTMPS
jgi:hypothetical protein